MLEEGSDEELWVNDAKRCGLYAPDYIYIHCPVDHAVQDGEEFDIAGIHILALNIPGHSPDSVCYVMTIDGRRSMFNGDAFFWGGVIGLLNYPGSDLREYHKSLPRLQNLRIDALLPGHGLFCLKGGQAIIDRAAANLKAGVFVPFCVGQLPISVI